MIKAAPSSVRPPSPAAKPMGNCLITVHVTGSHHNGDPTDIDQMAAKFVDGLKCLHNVTSATITHGGENDLLSTTSRLPLKGKSNG